MDISSIEPILINSKIRYRILSSGIEVNLGGLQGSFFIKYNRANDNLIFGSKWRWGGYAISAIAFAYLISISTTNPMMILMWAFFLTLNLTKLILKERNIFKIKKAVCKNVILTNTSNKS